MDVNWYVKLVISNSDRDKWIKMRYHHNIRHTPCESRSFSCLTTGLLGGVATELCQDGCYVPMWCECQALQVDRWLGLWRGACCCLAAPREKVFFGRRKQTTANEFTMHPCVVIFVIYDSTMKNHESCIDQILGTFLTLKLKVFPAVFTCLVSLRSTVCTRARVVRWPVRKDKRDAAWPVGSFSCFSSKLILQFCRLDWCPCFRFFF